MTERNDGAEPPLSETASVSEILGYAAGLAPGQVKALPLITGAELCTLGAMSASLVDQDEWSWWTGKSAADRFRLSTLALQTLVGRELLDAPPGEEADTPGPEVQLRARPRLAVILTARTRPSFIALQRSGANGDPRDNICMYGISDASAGLRAVLATERMGHMPPQGNVYLHALKSRAGCAATLAYSACEHLDTSKKALRRKRQTWVIDIYHSADRPYSDRFEVTRDGETLAAAHDHAGTVTSSVCADRKELAMLIEKALPGEQA
jgi:hypothetical protein